jgi:hypothetical protein
VLKMVSFLEGKWIPGFESTSNPRFVEPGKYMTVERAAPTHHQLKQVPGYDPSKPHKVGQVRTPTTPRQTGPHTPHTAGVSTREIGSIEGSNRAAPIAC